VFLENPKKYFLLIIFSAAVLQGAENKSLYLPSFFSRFCTLFLAAFAKQQISFDGFLRDSVRVWLLRFHLTHRGKRFCKVGSKNFLRKS